MKKYVFAFLTLCLSGMLYAKVSFEFLDEEKDITKKDVFFSVSSLLDTSYLKDGELRKFHTNIEKIFNAKYFGYALEAIKEGDEYQWSDSVKIFTARYGKEYTANWRPSGETPDDPDFAFKDARETAKDFTEVSAKNPLDESKNLILLRGRIRTAFENKSYVYKKALMIVYVDKSNATRKSAIYVSIKDSYELFLSTPTFPENISQTSLTNIVKAADITTGVNQGTPPILDVPYHTYISETYRYENGKSLRGHVQPYGQSLTIDEVLRSTLQKCLQSDALEDDEFKTIYRKMESL